MNIELVIPNISQAMELAGQKNDPDVSRYIGNRKYPYTFKDAQEEISEYCEKEGKSRIARTILVDGHVAGMIYFYLPSRGQKSVELGYWLGKKYWGQGITTCVTKQMCAYAFDNFDINRVCASALATNVGSWRVMEKIGMRREGEFIQSIYIDGEFYNDLYYAILREEFDKKRNEFS
jgi:[ribosomal protein S5]-alanine N-acetyltransferase